MSREWSQYTHRPRFLALVTCTMMAAQVNVFAQGSNGRVDLAGTQWELVTIQSMDDTEKPRKTRPGTP